MIKIEGVGECEILGKTEDVLAEYCFVTSRLAMAVDKKEIVKVFFAGLEYDTIMSSGEKYEDCWDKIEKMVDKAFKEEKK